MRGDESQTTTTTKTQQNRFTRSLIPWPMIVENFNNTNKKNKNKIKLFKVKRLGFGAYNIIMLLVFGIAERIKEWNQPQRQDEQRLTTTTMKNEKRRNKSESVALRARRRKKTYTYLCTMWNTKSKRLPFLQFFFFVILHGCVSRWTTLTPIISSKSEILDATELFIACFFWCVQVLEGIEEENNN